MSNECELVGGCYSYGNGLRFCFGDMAPRGYPLLLSIIVAHCVWQCYMAIENL